MYKLTKNPEFIKRIADEAFIPMRAENRDYVEYLAWVEAGNTPFPRDPQELAAEAAATTQAAKDAADLADLRLDAKLQALTSRTPAQIRTYVNANVSSLADAKDMLATLATLVGYLARKL